MDKFVYPSLRSRLKAEYKIYLLALLFILIADSIGQIQIPLGPGQFILFPIFYALIMGVLSGPQVTKIVKTKEVKAASNLLSSPSVLLSQSWGSTRAPALRLLSLRGLRSFFRSSEILARSFWQCRSPSCSA